ncbi:hypothetical protein [Bathymodiolus thermophilus thioautotrophic gill symbiont]|uniref:Uncharacterized protein n=1 Tax=Bathymodiolus thermophilus thioautotrophic gill symbiont TaxID=2360 RepID=A0A1J5TXR9_9GAMM|nr:hypothetical protein [Bathymodiolus thermophilus thioautotrophic gill symbiont]OIR25600.1 hypothetical protein BGC33_07195 [Bathymodiolus thermophilus thioautotrophic gill symbiont]
MKFALSMASFSWVIFLYLIHNEINVIHIEYLSDYIGIVNIFIFILICIVSGYLSLIFINKNALKSTKDELKISKIYPVYTDYMPIYLAICVIAFELNKITANNFVTILIITSFVFMVFHISNVFYLNPVWYVCGKRILKVENEKGNYIVIASKSDDYKAMVNIKKLKKIDEYVFYKTKE